MIPYQYYRRFDSCPNPIPVVVSERPVAGLFAIIRGKRVENYRKDDAPHAVAFFDEKGIAITVDNGT